MFNHRVKKNPVESWILSCDSDNQRTSDWSSRPAAGPPGQRLVHVYSCDQFSPIPPPAGSNLWTARVLTRSSLSVSTSSLTWSLIIFLSVHVWSGTTHRDLNPEQSAPPQPRWRTYGPGPDGDSQSCHWYGPGPGSSSGSASVLRTKVQVGNKAVFVPELHLIPDWDLIRRWNQNRARLYLDQHRLLYFDWEQDSNGLKCFDPTLRSGRFLWISRWVRMKKTKTSNFFTWCLHFSFIFRFFLNQHI